MRFTFINNCCLEEKRCVFLVNRFNKKLWAISNQAKIDKTYFSRHAQK